MGDLVGHAHQRIGIAGFTAGMDGAVHFGHELVEMSAALGGNGRGGEEQVHRHGLATPHAAPDVEALRGSGRRLAEQTANQAGCFDRTVQRRFQHRQPGHKRRLRGIRLQFARRQQFGIAASNISQPASLPGASHGPQPSAVPGAGSCAWCR